MSQHRIVTIAGWAAVVVALALVFWAGRGLTEADLAFPILQIERAR